MKHHSYGQTWWGKAWLEALGARAESDPSQLIRGRAYARGDRVHGLTVVPGAVHAQVQGSRTRPYTVIVTVPVFTDPDWAGFLDTIATRLGHLAALLTGELAPGIGTEVDPIPGPGELQATCSCPDLAEPCKHTAAVCYLTADALDADAFVLLLLRGRTKSEVLADLRARRQPAWSAPGGMLATHAYHRELRPLPVPVPPPRRPGSPALLPAQPPAASGVSAPELTELTSSAARRAWELLSGQRGSPARCSAGSGTARTGSRSRPR